MKFKKNSENIKLIVLASFLGGSGTKLLHGQLDNSEEIASIPAYPLLYFYPHWFEWKKKYKNLNSKKVLHLLFKHHASLIDTRKIRSWNGLYALGKKQNMYVKISKKKFSKYFLDRLENKKINSLNVLLAIHYAYALCQNKNLTKIKYFLYHIHTYEYIAMYFSQDFNKFKMILCIRNPLDHFWRRLRQNHRVEDLRYDITDQEHLKNYSYLNMIKMCFQDYSFKGKEFKNKKFFITFESLKLKNTDIIKSICSGLKIKYSTRFNIPRFAGLEWWGDKIYEGFKKNKMFEKKTFADHKGKEENFFYYEVFVIEKILSNFFKKFNYKFYTNQKSTFQHFFFLFFLILPSKYGIKLFFSRLSLKTFIKYIKASYNEAFKINLKNYYFNAMYRHKWSYRYIYLLKYNFLRKSIYDNEKNNSLVIKLLRLIYFLYKIIFYIFIQIELILLYLYKVYFFLKFYFYIKKKI